MTAKEDRTYRVLVIGPLPLAQTLAERLEPRYVTAYGDPAIADLVNFLRADGAR